MNYFRLAVTMPGEIGTDSKTSPNPLSSVAMVFRQAQNVLGMPSLDDWDSELIRKLLPMQTVDPASDPSLVAVRPKKNKKKKDSKKKELPGIRRESLNMIRTTYRNNIELTNIADNKANILLSLNALMITLLIPIVLSNLDVIAARTLYLPIVTLSATCFTTIIMAALATRPIKMGNQDVQHGDTSSKSPFFFGNYFQMKASDYLDMIENAIDDPRLIRRYIKQDLYFMGKGLGEKYTKIRLCYNVFIAGLIMTVLAMLVVIIA